MKFLRNKSIYLACALALIANVGYSLTRHAEVTKAVIGNVSLIPAADTFVYDANPETNYGTRNTLEIDGSPVKVGYIKFDLSSLAGKEITLAEFRFTVRDGSVSTFNYKSVADTSWGETTMTFQNRPSAGTIFATHAAPAASSPASVNMTSFVSSQAGQVMSFAIDSTGTDGYSYYSRNSSTDKPYLYVEYNELVPSPIPSPSLVPSPLPSVLPSPLPSSSPTPAPVTIAAAGDIACNTTVSTPTTCQERATSDLVLGINPDKVLALGDLQYGNSSVNTFMTYYDTTWGRFKSITRPVLGNHEDNITGFFDYWNGVGVQDGLAGPRPRSYYSFDLGSWHIVALNSNCAEVAGGGCAVGSEQETWLRADLAAHPAQCTLAFMHHAYYTSGSTGPETAVRPLIQALYDNNTDILLAGHKHMYERFAPQNPDYALDTSRGIRSFSVGTGGKDLSGVGNKTFPNMQARNGKTFGILKMGLGQGTYSWQFLPIPGSTFTDSGSGTCH